MNTNAAAPLTVYFDGACPLCRREIAFLRARTGEDVVYCDLEEAPPLPAGLDPAAARGRFHVKAGEDEVLSGAAAFAALWARSRGPLAWLGRALRWPPAGWFAERAYRAFLKVRPVLQRLARGLEARGERACDAER